MAKIDAEQVRRISEAAESYVVHNYGDVASIGLPRQNDSATGWEVPIFAETKFGFLRCGSLSLDDSGTVLSPPDRFRLSSVVDEMVKRLDVA